jgi:hypothetical protein
MLLCGRLAAKSAAHPLLDGRLEPADDSVLDPDMFSERWRHLELVKPFSDPPPGNRTRTHALHQADSLSSFAACCECVADRRSVVGAREGFAVQIAWQGGMASRGRINLTYLATSLQNYTRQAQLYVIVQFSGRVMDKARWPHQ